MQTKVVFPYIDNPAPLPIIQKQHGGIFRDDAEWIIGLADLALCGSMHEDATNHQHHKPPLNHHQLPFTPTKIKPHESLPHNPAFIFLHTSHECLTGVTRPRTSLRMCHDQLPHPQLPGKPFPAAKPLRATAPL